jgi:hypothetical protein
MVTRPPAKAGPFGAATRNYAKRLRPVAVASPSRCDDLSRTVSRYGSMEPTSSTRAASGAPWGAASWGACGFARSSRCDNLPQSSITLRQITRVFWPSGVVTRGGASGCRTAFGGWNHGSNDGRAMTDGSSARIPFIDERVDPQSRSVLPRVAAPAETSRKTARQPLRAYRRQSGHHALPRCPW